MGELQCCGSPSHLATRTTPAAEASATGSVASAKALGAGVTRRHRNRQSRLGHHLAHHLSPYCIWVYHVYI